MEWSNYAVPEMIKINSLYSLYNTIHSKGFHFDGEIHDFWECVYVASGEICVSGDDRIYNLKSGDIIFHKPMEMHKFFLSETSNAHLFIFSFSMSGEYESFFHEKVFSLNSQCRQIINEISEYASLPSYINYIEKIYTTPGKLQSLATDITKLLLSLIHSDSLFETLSTPETIMFKKAVNYMNDNIEKKVSVQEIAKYCLVSVSTVKRLFDKFSGVSVHKYFLTLKIKVATQMIKSGKTVTETSDFLGFSDQSYFSSCYKRETGIQPSQLRTKL